MTLKSLKEGLNRWLLPGFMLVSCIGLLTIGIPRFLHELMLVPGTEILERINAGEPVTDDELTILEKSRQDALSFVELPKAYTDLGSSYLMRARHAVEREERQKYAAMSIEASTKGLNMAPLNTFSWFRVATANVLLGPEHRDKALEAWNTSIATARFEPFILMQRIHLGTILYRNMTLEDIDVLKDQLELAYRRDRHAMRRYAQQNHLIAWMTFLSRPGSEMASFFSK